MITIISGTNRKNSECLRFAKVFYKLYKKKTTDTVRLLALEEISHDWFHPDMYTSKGQSESIVRLQDEYFLMAQKFIFITPEYNGSFPGVVKLLIDAASVREYKSTFVGKKAALVGIASGRAGNLRGMDHLSGVLQHVGITVMPNKLPISRIVALMDHEGKIVDESTLQIMEQHVAEFLAF